MENSLAEAMALVLAMHSADTSTTEFPAFDESLALAIMAESNSPLPLSPANKLVDRLVSSPNSRNPSPQPTHVSSLPYRNGSGNGHRVLRSATVGYTAPEFKGKREQMISGQ